MATLFFSYFFLYWYGILVAILLLSVFMVTLEESVWLSLTSAVGQWMSCDWHWNQFLLLKHKWSILEILFLLYLKVCNKQTCIFSYLNSNFCLLKWTKIYFFVSAETLFYFLVNPFSLTFLRNSGLWTNVVDSPVNSFTPKPFKHQSVNSVN